jgi:hypothetical protein
VRVVRCANSVSKTATGSGAAETVGASGVASGVATSHHVVGSIAVRVDARIGGVGYTRVMGAGCTLGGAVVSLVVTVDSLLDLVNDARHGGYVDILECLCCGL